MKTYDVFLGNGSTYRSCFINAMNTKEAIAKAKEKYFNEEGIQLNPITVTEY